LKTFVKTTWKYLLNLGKVICQLQVIILKAAFFPKEKQKKKKNKKKEIVGDKMHSGAFNLYHSYNLSLCQA
jgi:hypothetical protein